MKNDDALDAALALIARGGPDAGSLWRHLKSGHVYRVVCCAVREADLVPLVVYRDEHPRGEMFDRKFSVNWSRPLAEFADGRFVMLAPAGAS